MAVQYNKRYWTMQSTPQEYSHTIKNLDPPPQRKYSRQIRLASCLPGWLFPNHDASAIPEGVIRPEGKLDAGSLLRFWAPSPTHIRAHGPLGGTRGAARVLVRIYSRVQRFVEDGDRNSEEGEDERTRGQEGKYWKGG